MRSWVYLRRFLTSWVAEDPDPVYSRLDSCDGLGDRGAILGVVGGEPRGGRQLKPQDRTAGLLAYPALPVMTPDRPLQSCPCRATER